ncbi:hypothetical protein BDZ89DRAFT_592847 [Hymenopellis radicata]|nr:hypothetical protein BDZ89DRAFT_592847 [Hymenopellis radicata]
MARPLPVNPPSNSNRPSLTMQFASMGLQEQQWAAPLPTPPSVSPTSSSMASPMARPRPMSMTGPITSPGGPHPAPMHRTSSSVSTAHRPTSSYDHGRPVRQNTVPAQPISPQHSQYQAYPAHYQSEQSMYQEQPHPQAYSSIHPQAQIITQNHPQAQILQRQYQQQQLRQSHIPASMRGALSSGFQPGVYSPASPSAPRDDSPTRSSFTPTSSFPNGPPPGGFPRPGGGASTFVQPPPRPPSMISSSYSQPAQPISRPPSMTGSSYSQPAPSRFPPQPPGDTTSLLDFRII